MIYQIEKNKIVVNDLTDFNINHIVLCGQVFSYIQNDSNFIILSGDKMCTVRQFEDRAVIETEDIEYFINYFDLNTDYAKIKRKLSAFPELSECLAFGSGIRILKQNIFETLVSFVISANNNIKRIKNSLMYFRTHLGKNMGGYFAFPTLSDFSKCDEDFFKSAGVGYRAAQMVKLFNQLRSYDLTKLQEVSNAEIIKTLLSLSGVGEKVAHCILLFGLGKQDAFPVDTWIEKIFNQTFGGNYSRTQMTEFLINRYGNLSGYAQQYLFFYKRGVRE